MATAALEYELLLPEPEGKQYEWLDSSASRKVLRVGRRGGKTRFAFVAALNGHGPGWDQDRPMFPGVLQGGDVVWIAQNYPNLTTVLWREEIIPRMAHLPWVTLNNQLHDVNIPGLGSLLLRSGDREAIDSIRGIGKRLLGVIIDEAAWLDLRGALQDVILLALADNGGWLIIMSTTNAGSDGGYDETGAPQVPSYFNLLCKEIRAGKRSKDWQEFTGTAYDNPTLSRAAIDELVAEYPPGSPALKQEVWAELLEAGIGLALPDLSAETHVVPRFEIPSHWQQFGAFDWGFIHPYSFGWYTVSEDGVVFKVDTVWGRNEIPRQIAAKVSAAVPIHKLAYIVASHDCWADLKARGENAPTIAEQMVPFGFNLMKASVSRVTGLNNLRQYVDVPKGGQPRFRFMDTEGNRKCLAQIQGMQIDPKDIEDALKVDADYAGRGGDDGYDETRYALASRPLTVPLKRFQRYEDTVGPTDLATGKALPDPLWQKFEQSVKRQSQRTVRPRRHLTRTVET